MPGEEMEITTDFGPIEFGEDIDIDLDFAGGQHDEDLELADFDQAQDMQNFNADTRDELMAERDDASYGMIDADDVEQNEFAAATNDIEIDLADPDENLWEQSASHGELLENADEIDYANENGVDYQDIGAVNIDNTERIAAGEQPTAESTAENQQSTEGHEPQPEENLEEAAAEGSPHESHHESPTDVNHVTSTDEPSGLKDDGNSDHAHEEHFSPAAASDHNSVEGQLFEQELLAEQDRLAEQEQQPEQLHTPESPYEENEEVVVPSAQDSAKADGCPIPAATRHTVYVSYHGIDYRLFAESKDDDPSTYFLPDTSALDFKLGKFLSSLREVIAEEVSPLDELMIQVDGLGVEFSESSSCELLESYTFGEILSLYDKLVQNDGDESSTDFYLYLIVGPNCLKRLVALFESAKSGRGLSEIGVYRDSVPADEDQASQSQAGESEANKSQAAELEAGEFQADELQDNEFHDDEVQGEESQADESQGADAHTDGYRAAEPHDGQSHAEESHVRVSSQSPHLDDNEYEGDKHDDAGPNQNDGDAGSPSLQIPAPEGAENTVASPQNTEEKSEQETGPIVDGKADKDEEDDLIDYSDDELDLSLPQQGNTHISYNSAQPYPCNGMKDCLCDECFSLNSMDIDEQPPASQPMAPGVFSYQRSPSQPVVKRPVAALPGQRPPQHSLLSPQFSSFNLQTDANYHSLQDQQTNIFSGDSAQEAEKASTGVTAVENGASDQHTTPLNGVADAAVSDATSATATLVGDDKDEVDEIDYSDDEAELNDNNDDPSHDGNPSNDYSNHAPGVAEGLQVPIDDEITWESENEDNEAKDEPVAASTDVVQVSATEKRPRPDSDLSDSETGPIDVKRRRSS
ncbi:hypothetical protein GGR52DRAFT_567259 [Hypoxylon sp. FL1284]|nr:hypothetical protein GGR52DRAFT_567259 [Hypoxylon sp. FL1284]